MTNPIMTIADALPKGQSSPAVRQKIRNHAPSWAGASCASVTVCYGVHSVSDIKTIDDLIAEFGGPARFGEWLDIGQEAVSAFKWRGVPSGWHLRLLAEVRRRGCNVHPSVFGLTEEEAAGLFDVAAPATPIRPSRKRKPNASTRR